MNIDIIANALGILAGLTSLVYIGLTFFVIGPNKRKPQFVKDMSVVYCVARFSCGCILTNGKLATCTAHSLLEEVEA